MSSNRELHLPAGKLLLIEREAGPVLTNALGSRVHLPQNGSKANLKTVVDISAERFTPYWNISSNVGVIKRKLAWCGIMDDEATWDPTDGKFVFMRDGTFFICSQADTHAYLPALVRMEPYEAISAGFICVTPEEVRLWGTSNSLYGLTPDGDGRDVEAIAKQLKVRNPQPGDEDGTTVSAIAERDRN